MRGTYSIGKRLLAMLLSIAMIAAYLPGMILDASAATTVYGGLGVKETDPATVNNWKNYIGQLDTSLAGSVWTDKSVFETAEDYLNATDEDENFSLSLDNPRNFMLALSAMASTKTIVGYSTLPTDTVFVLDVSGSMDSSSRDERMVQAANKAIGDLLALNNYNRIGVVLYSDSSTLLLPLDRYTTTSTTILNDETIPSYIYLSNNDRVSVSDGVHNSDNGRPNSYREVIGGTYIQSGIYMGMEELTDPNLDTVIAEGFQAGTTRTPIMVLMSDGAPTYGVNTYTTVGSRNMGDGNNTNADLSFMTQLSAAYAKAKIAQKYGSEVEPLFYTLGLSVGNDSYALSVMDPTNTRADDDVNEYWTDFNAAQEGDEITLENSDFWSWSQGWVERTVTKLNDGVDDNNDTLPLAQNYVDQYFSASNTNDLSTAFQSIVDTIILQTMYYPTLVEGSDVHHSGYLEFHDYIGPNMEVKSVEGVQLGQTLYTGERLAQLIATGMGTIENPTDAGNELVRSVVARLGMKDKAGMTAVDQARDLLDKAWRAGHLAYSVDYDGNIRWSNQICWYADADGEYLGFWDGEGVDEDMIGIAAYTVRSYGFLGEVGDGHRETDMLYATFQVRSALDDQGKVLEDIVYCRIPASLIPVTTYNIALNSNDPTTATEITMTVDGATAPLRLLFEVGLRKEIDLLDMEGTAVEDLKQDADGNFVFYTNQWDDTGVNAGETPDKLHNTYVTFKPSEENERYYYHEDMPIYVANGNRYVRYTGSTKPAANDGNTYYRAYVIYSAQTNGGAADYEIAYQQIPEQALAADRVAEAAGSGWVVKRGTLYLYEARGAVDKAANDTGTLAYAEYPNVHIDGAHGYHLDAILGNNGLLTIDAPEGLKLTKQADETIVDNGQTYTFNVELISGSHANADIYLVTEIDGLRSAWTAIDFTDTYSIELGIGDSAWLTGLPEGNQYRITETIDGEFKVSGITVDGTTVADAQVTVQDNHIADVEFTNTAVFTGDISISKNVISTYNGHESESFTFDFDVTVTGADAGETYATMQVKADGTEVQGSDITTNAAGVATFRTSLAHGQSLILVDLPEGASVTAVETQRPGFTSNMTNNTGTAQVVIGELTQVAFVNTYAAQPVSPYGIVDVFVEKILEGRVWAQGDSFTFELERHNADGSHALIERISVDYADADKIADFQSNTGEPYQAPGTYSYRISETAGTLPGVAYDTAICYFDVIVEDDGEGSLYIADVIGRQGVTVVHDELNDTWDVVADFINTYNANGAIQVSLGVTKDVEDNDANTGIGKDGFVFELYNADEDFNIIGTAPRATTTTNAQGVAMFRDTLFTEEDTFYFVLKEKAGSIVNMDYSEEVYYCTVEITSDPQTSGLVAKGTVVNSGGQTVYQETVEYDPNTELIPVLAYNAPFENIYNAEAVKAELSGTKVLNGRDIEDGEFTFELYEASYNGTQMAIGAYITNTTNLGNSFSFKDIAALTFEETGYHFFAIKEKAGDPDIGVTYDGRTVYVAVHVVADLATGKLVINALNYMDANTASVPAVFTNTYTAAATDLTLEADKEMTGTRSLASNMFQFSIYETADDTYTVSGTPLQTLANDADGNVEFDLHYTATGIHYYVIRERIPTNLDADGRLNGVKYDPTHYRIKVEVKDDLEGQLYTDVTYLDGEPSFTNDYTPAPTTATLQGVKTLSGHTQTADEFSFALYQTDARFVPLDDVADDITTNQAKGDGTFTFTFDEITYDKAGGYRYIIVEQDTGNSQVDYDPTVFYVLVEVTDNGFGQLVAKLSLGSAVNALGDITMPVTSMEFFNVFNHRPAQLTITGNKTLNGQSWDATDADHVFAFELYEANEQFAIVEGVEPMTATNDPAATGTEGVFAFETLTFEQRGTYYYVAKEKLPASVSINDLRDDANGITYDATQLNITVHVDIDPQDTTRLKATYTVDNTENAVVFTNTYTIEDQVSAVIRGNKVLVGKTPGVGQFSFKLYEADDNTYDLSGKLPVGTVSNAADGSFTFDKSNVEALTYTQEGTHYYVLMEDLSNPIEGIRYDTGVYYFQVDVTDDGNGGLNISVDCINGDENNIVFINTPYDELVKKDVALATDTENSVDGEKVQPGDILQYSITYYNADDANVTVIVTDTLPEAVTYVEDSANHNGVYDGEKLTWTLQVAAGQRETVTFRVQVNDADVFIENQAVVKEGNHLVETNVVWNHTYEEVGGKDVSSASDPEHISIDGQMVQIGQILEYTIDYTNTTGAPVDVTITDTIPAHTKLHDAGNSIVSGDVLTWTFASVQPKETVAVTFQVEVTDPGEVIENQAQIFDGTNKLTNKVTNSVPEKTVDKQTANLGDTLTYTISYTNKTGAPAKVVITDTLSEALTLVEGSAQGGVYANGTITWTIENVPAGEEVTVSFQAKVTGAADSVSNTAQIVENTANAVFSNETVTKVEQSNLTIKKEQVVGSGSATADKLTVKEGDEVTYILTVTNNGEGDAYGIIVTDRLPEGLTYVDKSVSAGGVYDNGIITWTLDTLKAGNSVQLTFKVKIPAVQKDTKWTNVATFVYDNNPDGEDRITESNKVDLEETYVAPPVKDPTVPQTGDNFQAVTFITLMILSSFGLAAVMVCKKREQNKENAE